MFLSFGGEDFELFLEPSKGRSAARERAVEHLNGAEHDRLAFSVAVRRLCEREWVQMANVVVAEDDDDLRAATVRVLSRAGHAVVAAPDGAQALQLVNRDHPDLVVSDIDMPVMSGIDLCLAIRADPELRDLPVVFVSGSLMPGDDLPVRAGATATVTKPFAVGDLLACVDKILQTHGEAERDPVKHR